MCKVSKLTCFFTIFCWKGDVPRIDLSSLSQNFPNVESTPNLPLETTADPWGATVSHSTLPLDSVNQADLPLFNALRQQVTSETFMQIPPELQAEFDAYSAYLDDFELHPVPDTLLSGQTDPVPSHQVGGELSAQTLREIQIDIVLLTDPLLTDPIPTRYHPGKWVLWLFYMMFDEWIVVKCISLCFLNTYPSFFSVFFLHRSTNLLSRRPPLLLLPTLWTHWISCRGSHVNWCRCNRMVCFFSCDKMYFWFYLVFINGQTWMI